MSDKITEFLAESKRVEEAATPGPWEHGDWWHIQGSDHCLCREDWGPAVVQRMSINGTMMEAHRHRRSTPIDSHVINTEPYRDGFPRAVVITTEEYGAIDPDDAEFIAHARTSEPRMRRALVGVLEIHRATPNGFGEVVCSSCLAFTSPMPGSIPWPCKTVRAIESALTEEESE